MRPGRRVDEPPEFNYEAHKQAHPFEPCVGPTVKNPTILFTTTDAPMRHNRILATIRCDENAKARTYVGELEISKDGGATVAKRRRKQVGAKRDRDTNTTVDLDIGRVNHKWKVRYRVRGDTDACTGPWVPGTSLVPSDAEAGWSDWLDPNDDEIPPAVTGLTLDVDQTRSHIRWDLPDETGNTDIPDLRISHLWVELWKDSIGGTLIQRDRYHHGERKHFRNPKPGSATYFARVYTVSHTGKKSTAATTSATRLTPSTPAAPSVAFDQGGPRPARWRAHVTVATVADTDAEIAKYVVQLVHKATHVAPTSGDKRSHGRVEGDATGDDLIETFRGIPRNHWVYARARAVDTQGRRSAFSAWTDAGQPNADADDDGADPGTIKKHAGASIPPGYLRCDGASYATATYADLFAVIGYTYGGAGANFTVPDFKGRHAIGVSSLYGLGADEGLAEGSRSAGHGHLNDETETTPALDSTATTPTSDATGATADIDHEHNVVFSGDHDHSGVTASASAGTAMGGSGTPVDLTRIGHTHAIPSTGDQHDHTMGGPHVPGQEAQSKPTGSSHPHNHNHGGHGHGHHHGGHKHQHGHDSKTRPHKAAYFIIKT